MFKYLTGSLLRWFKIFPPIYFQIQVVLVPVFGSYTCGYFHCHWRTWDIKALTLQIQNLCYGQEDTNITANIVHQESVQYISWSNWRQTQKMTMAREFHQGGISTVGSSFAKFFQPSKQMHSNASNNYKTRHLDNVIIIQDGTEVVHHLQQCRYCCLSWKRPVPSPGKI